jgi:hypothetical protein
MNCGVVIAFSSTPVVSQPVLPRVGHVRGDRFAALARLDVLDLELHRQRLLRLQPEVDHPDLASRPSPGRFLQRLVDQRARGIGVGHREEQDLLAGLAEQVEQIPRRPRRLALRG